MRPEDSDQGLLWDMMRYAERVTILTSRTHFSEYEKDWTMQLAMERAIEVIGEAANKVSKSFREQHPEIPWQRIIGQRHFLAHEYGEVKQERIWQTATVHVPELIEQLRPLLPGYQSEGADD